MDTMRPDERAAGVISGADPYRELELYLEKVNEEIGEVFDQWRTSDPKKKTPVTPSIQIPSRNRSTSLPRYEAETNEVVSSPTRKLDDASGLPPRRPLRKNGYTDVDAIGNHDNDATTPTFQRKAIRKGVILGTSSISDVIRNSGTKSLPCRTVDKIEKHNGNLIGKGNSISNNKKHDFNGEHSLNSWSEGLLAEFNSIIANELSQLQSTGSHIFEENEKTANKDNIKVYDDPLINGCRNSPKDAKVRLGISRSLSWDSHEAASDNNRSATTPTPPLTSSVMSDTVVRNRTLSLSRILRKNMFGGVAKDIPGRGDAILVRVASLPDTDTLHKTASDSDIVKRQRKTRQVQCNVFKCESTGALASEKLCTKSLGMDLPVSPNRKPKPPPKEFKGISMYKDVLRKKVTSSEHLQNGGRSKRNGRATVDSGWPDSGEDDSDTVEEIKYVPKLRSRSASDGIPERFPVAKDSQASSENEFPEEEEVLKRTGSGMLPVALQSFLTKLRPKRSRGGARCSSPPSCCLLPDRPPVDMGTQTSPALSRSSSFTWVSDCSSSLLLHTTGSVSDTMDDDNRSTTSSADDSPDSAPVHRPGEGVFPCQCDCTSSRDSLSDSPLESLESPDREEPESGIGTASPPRNKSAVSSGGPNKPKRKETWERLRRRPSSGRPPTGYHRAGTGIKSQEVWIRQENVETQTTKSNQDEGGGKSSEDLNVIDTSSGVDGATTPEMLEEEPEVRDAGSLPLPGGKGRPIAVRPHCLPVRPQHLRSSSSPVVNRRFLSPGERRDDKMNATATSLKKATTTLVVDLGNKSSSAPLLVKKRASPGGDINKPEDTAKKRILKQPRSQSERHLTEIEAAEACKWLRAAGFPQYAQMYEDLQFPIDVSGVQKDHPFLDPDSLHSLFRRLHALNRCANMKVDNVPKNKVDDSDEDDSCALSENWTFQPESRRWSRVCDVTAQHVEKLQALSAASQAQGSPGEGDTARHPQEDEDDDEEEEEEDYDPEEIPVISSLRYGSLPPCSVHPGGDQELMAVRFRRTGSERLRDGAKALLKRMESLKSRRRRRQNREGVIISGPQVLDVMTMRQRMKDLNCVDVSPTSPHPPSSDLPPTGLPTPTHSAPSHLVSAFGDDSSSYCSDGSSVATPPHSRGRSKPVRTKKNLSTRSNRPDDIGTLSDSEVQPSSWRHQYLKDANSNHTKVLQFIDGSSRGPQDQEPSRRPSGSGKPQATRGGSLNLGKESQRYRDKLQRTFRKDVTVYRREKSGSPDYTGSQDSSSTLASQAESDHDDGGDTTPKHKAIVVRWHSFQRGSSRPDSYLFRQDSSPIRGAHPMNSLSCGQLLVLRKLALLKLTACMERYCPTHRTGWNWELPKFIRKIKSPDYKDKTVFGVPLLLSLQRNGQALPKCIQAALRWLRVNSLDQVGLFRKSGVRSRIQKLKLIAESQGESISYEGQQAYDVADMVKQYFRELPEALLTNKLSETFTAIFQHVPVNLRMEAVQCVVLLLPDEHREALQTLLEFLSQVSARAACNQMTASNLAVCLAPSLFHLHHAPSSTTSRSTSASPRRRKTVGVPDPRELSENKAAHDCLLYLIKEHKDLFMVTEEMMTQCHFSYMEESVPVALEELGTELHQDWRGYLYTCTTALLKEARDRSRGWVNVSCATDTLVDVAYKKVGDGHPLRLWRVSTEVEAPPLEVLQRVLRERHVWDTSLLKWRVVARLDALAEVFQYVCANMAPLAAKDFCVLRSWRTDLPKGACVIVETSVEHPDGPVMLGGVRGIVLASRYLIEPCGSGKSRIMHLSRVDTKGRTPEWYNKSYGHICALYLTRIRTSFKHNADGPESKV